MLKVILLKRFKKQKLNDDPGLYYSALKGFREENKIKWNDDSLKKAYNDYVDNLISTARSNAQQNS